MKTILVLSLIVAPLIQSRAQGFGQTTTTTTAATTPPSAGNSARERFAAGLLSEEGEGDLAAAAAAYRQTIQAFDRQRDEAANAIFRLGEVYRKLGRMEEAKVQYARILREFPDMVRLTELSHDLLFGEEPKPGGAVGSGFGGAGMGAGGGGGGGGGGGLADPAYYEGLMMQRYGIAPGRMPAPAQPTANRTGSAGARDEASRIQCINNLKQLGLAVRVYASDHEGVFPSRIGLMSNEISVTKVLVCPSDSSHQPAESWDAFDPALHLTYEFPGASAREDHPQTVLFRCPIHGHVALADGSVQEGRAESPPIAPGMSEIMRRRYGLGGMPQSTSTPAISTTQPATLAITVLRDGTLTVNGGPMELPAVIQLIQQMPDEMRANTLIEIKDEMEPESSRAIEVINACQQAGISQFAVATHESSSAIRHEIARLDKEHAVLVVEMESNLRDLDRTAPELDRLESAIAEARTRKNLAQERLEALRFPADRLPGVVGQDARYQRLKAEYETAVLDGDKAAQERARARLQEWVGSIYRPELESEAELADHRLAASVAEAEELLRKQQALEAQQRELRGKLTTSQQRMNQLTTLLNRTQ